VIADQTWIGFPTFRESAVVSSSWVWRSLHIWIRLQGIKLPLSRAARCIYKPFQAFSVFWVFFLTIYSLVELNFSAGRVCLYINMRTRVSFIVIISVHLHPQTTSTYFQCIQLARFIYPRLKDLSRTTCDWPSKNMYLLSHFFHVFSQTVEFSHPDSNVGSAIIWYDLNSVSLIVLRVHIIVPCVYWNISSLVKLLLFVELLCCQLFFLVCAYFLKCRDFVLKVEMPTLYSS